LRNNTVTRFLSEYSALSRILEPRDMAALAKATVMQAPAILRTRKLTALDAAMSRNMTVHVGQTSIVMPLDRIDRILTVNRDNPTFGNIREIYARDCYFEHLRLKSPVGAVLDLGANRGMFSLLALLALQANVVVGVEPTERGVELVSRFTHRAGDTCGALEQIGTPDVADEEEVAGEKAER